MRASPWRKTSSRLPGESGQAIVFVLLALGIFLLGALVFAVDLGHLLFRRQAGQTAADAACVAGAMDLLAEAQGAATGHQGYTTGEGFDCAPGSTATPCQYAALNGYNSPGIPGTSPGNLVSVSFPGSVPGVTPPPPGLAPTPFMRVDVVDHVQTFFYGMLGGSKILGVQTSAVCGLLLDTSPIPLVVLDPQGTDALRVQGNPRINIIGGPGQSIQVNSGAASAINTPWGNAAIDLSRGGPSYDGSTLGVFGGPATAPGGFVTAGSGTWASPMTPVGDPYAQVPTPAQPPAPTTPADLAANPNCTSANMALGRCTVAYHDAFHGCPTLTGCTYYSAGYYPSGITVKKETAIFDPGLYYLNGGLALQSNSMVRPGTGVGDGSSGTTFYLTGNPPTCSGQTGLVCVGSDSGSGTTDPFSTFPPSPTPVQCPGGPAPNANLALPATLPGNILLAPCTGTYGDPSGENRGILFFGDRASSAGGGWGGGGGFLLAGSMYFHHCNASGTGVSCGAYPAFYNEIFTLQGNSGSSSYVLGNIITDNLSLGGNPTINMALNPGSVYSILKASLLR